MLRSRVRPDDEDVIRVLTVDDHAVLRAGVNGLLESEDGIDPVGEADSCDDAQSEFERLRPDVVIADFRLRGGDGLELCRRLERSEWPARVLIFSAFAGDELRLSARIAGAAGVLGKGSAGELLLASVRAVAAGGMPSGRVAPEVVRSAAERLDPADVPIFGMRFDGVPAHEIANVLQLDGYEVDARIDAIVDVIKPRTEPAPLVAPHGAGRWV
jgi:DNA-binding NarL/FixJ family response regulator